MILSHLRLPFRHPGFLTYCTAYRSIEKNQVEISLHYSSRISPVNQMYMYKVGAPVVRDNWQTRRTSRSDPAAYKEQTNRRQLTDEESCRTARPCLRGLWVVRHVSRIGNGHPEAQLLGGSCHPPGMVRVRYHDGPLPLVFPAEIPRLEHYFPAVEVLSRGTVAANDTCHGQIG